MMAILAVGIAGLAGSGDKVSLMPLFIGLLGGPIFALFWLSARRDRRPDFEKGATRLATGLHNYLATGSARAQEM